MLDGCRLFKARTGKSSDVHGVKNPLILLDLRSVWRRGSEPLVFPRRWLRLDGFVLGYAVYEGGFVVNTVELVGEGSVD
jgi:hypothetical protein